MRNYNESDYALNKYSEGIVYKFADGSKQTIMIEDYLAANPKKTAEDFAQLKAISDEVYHQQDLGDTGYGKRKRTFDMLPEQKHPTTVSIDVELIHKADGQAAIKAAKQLLDSGNLTEVQRRRFILHFFQGMSTRQIGALESVSHIAVYKSIRLATEKMKTFFIK
ncbi:MAG: RNA polymerase subunit sigma-24 [Christensenellaceae bacterium]